MSKSSKRSSSKGHSLPPSKGSDNIMVDDDFESCSGVSARRISFGTILIVELL